MLVQRRMHIVVVVLRLGGRSELHRRVLLRGVVRGRPPVRVRPLVAIRVLPLVARGVRIRPPLALLLMFARASVLGYCGARATSSLVYIRTGGRAGAASFAARRDAPVCPAPGAAAAFTECTTVWLATGIGGFKRATTGRSLNATAGCRARAWPSPRT